MGILIYQIGIFIAIQLSAYFGKNSRNIATIIISVFTILQVFTNQLMILQFCTIAISFFLSKTLFSVENNVNSEYKTEIDNLLIETNKLINDLKKDDIVTKEKTYSPDVIKQIERMKNSKINFMDAFKAGEKTYAIAKENPLLMKNISSAYKFLNEIVEANPSLSYIRKGSTLNENFPKPIDIYQFKQDRNIVTTIYVYPYYSNNITKIPDVLKLKAIKLNRSDIEDKIKPSNKKSKKHYLKLNNIDLSGINLSNLDLSNIDFSNSNLSESNLSNSKLDKSNLEMCNLINIDLSNASLVESNLNGGNLLGANLINANLKNAFLSVSYRERTISEKKELIKNKKANPNDFILSITEPNDPICVQCILKNTNLKNTDFEGANLTSSDMSNSTLTNTNFKRAILESADLSKSNLTNVNLNEAILFNVVFTDANLIDISLINSKIHNNTFYNTNISEEQLSEVIIESTEEEIKAAELKYEFKKEQDKFWMDDFNDDIDNDQQNETYW
ncbi:pentapeptide repeat-containing protein [Polaribacter atrinae]|uniref:pentapeptide repeat-containing protein n=1 Tax=Polaribacter atrinae TaxID=1333662 RepID=UPI0030F525FD